MTGGEDTAVPTLPRPPTAGHPRGSCQVNRVVERVTVRPRMPIGSAKPGPAEVQGAQVRCGGTRTSLSDEIFSAVGGYRSQSDLPTTTKEREGGETARRAWALAAGVWVDGRLRRRPGVEMQDVEQPPRVGRRTCSILHDLRRIKIRNRLALCRRVVGV